MTHNKPHCALTAKTKQLDCGKLQDDFPEIFHSVIEDFCWMSIDTFNETQNAQALMSRAPAKGGLLHRPDTFTHKSS